MDIHEPLAEDTLKGGIILVAVFLQQRDDIFLNDFREL